MWGQHHVHCMYALLAAFLFLVSLGSSTIMFHIRMFRKWGGTIHCMLLAKYIIQCIYNDIHNTLCIYIYIWYYTISIYTQCIYLQYIHIYIYIYIYIHIYIYKYVYIIRTTFCGAFTNWVWLVPGKYRTLHHIRWVENRRFPVDFQ